MSEDVVDKPKRVHRGGRPTKLTLERQQKICDALRGGNFLHTAASYAGINNDTLHTWLRRGEREASGIYRGFYDAVQAAQADCEVAAVAGIKKAGFGGEWTALAWLLERKFPDRWAMVHRFKFITEKEIDGLLEALADKLKSRGLPDAVFHTVLDVLQEIAAAES